MKNIIIVSRGGFMINLSTVVAPSHLYTMGSADEGLGCPTQSEFSSHLIFLRVSTERDLARGAWRLCVCPGGIICVCRLCPYIEGAELSSRGRSVSEPHTHRECYFYTLFVFFFRQKNLIFLLCIIHKFSVCVFLPKFWFFVYFFFIFLVRSSNKRNTACADWAVPYL